MIVLVPDNLQGYQNTVTRQNISIKNISVKISPSKYLQYKISPSKLSPIQNISVKKFKNIKINQMNKYQNIILHIK